MATRPRARGTELSGHRAGDPSGDRVRCGCRAPGYGFLSENPAFIEACDAAGIVFVGPPAGAVRAMGLKDAAKRAMEDAGVPVVPGYHGEEQDDPALLAHAREIGFPVLVKAVAGGGGKGMRRADSEDAFTHALDGPGARRARASATIGCSSSAGSRSHATSRSRCSPTRTATPCTCSSETVRCSGDIRRSSRNHPHRACHRRCARRWERRRSARPERSAIAGRAPSSSLPTPPTGCGTNRFWFMEMNTRLQVEHPVTEMVTGIDLVEWQLRVAAGERLPVAQSELSMTGHAVEARVYAEDPDRGFLPSTGTSCISRFHRSPVTCGSIAACAKATPSRRTSTR